MELGHWVTKCDPFPCLVFMCILIYVRVLFIRVLHVTRYNAANWGNKDEYILNIAGSGKTVQICQIFHTAVICKVQCQPQNVLFKLHNPYNIQYHSQQPKDINQSSLNYASVHYQNKKHLKNVGPIRRCEPPHAACFTLPFTRCRYCRTPPAHRCPQQRRRQQRQRVTEGAAMAP